MLVGTPIFNLIMEEIQCNTSLKLMAICSILLGLINTRREANCMLVTTSLELGETVTLQIQLMLDMLAIT